MSNWEAKSGEILFGFFVILVCLGIVISAFFPMTLMFSQVQKDLISGNGLIFLLILALWCAVLFAYFWTKEASITSKQLWSIIAVMTAISLGARLSFVLSFDQGFYSDFRDYWNYASEMVENGLMPASSFAVTRALAFYYPLIWIFGNEYIVFKLSNIVLLTVSALASAYIAARWMSYKSAIIVFFIISTIPETYYASLIPSHDITGAFYLIASLLFLLLSLDALHSRRWVMLTILLCVLSFTLVALEMQRNTTVFFLIGVCAAVTFFGILRFASRKLKNMTFLNAVIMPVVLTIIVPFTFFTLISSNTAGTLTLSDASSSYYRVVQLVGFNTLNDGTYRSLVNLRNNYALKLTGGDLDRARFLKSLFYSDLYYDPLWRVSNYFDRANRLYTLSSQLPFYVGRLNGLEAQEQETFNQRAKLLTRSYYSIFLAVLIISALTVLIRFQRVELPVLVALSLMSTVALALILVGENQPRYLFMGYFLWPFVIARAMAVWTDETPSEGSNSESVSVQPSVVSALMLGVAISGVLLGYGLFRWCYATSQERMIDLSTFNHVTCRAATGNVDCNESKIAFPETTFDRDWSLLRLQLPALPERGDFSTVEHTFSGMADGRYIFEVFVQQPYHRADKKKGFFDISVQANDQRSLLHLEDTDASQHVRLMDVRPVHGDIHVSFMIECKECGSGASWQRASVTNFRFARIYPAP